MLAMHTESVHSALHPVDCVFAEPLAFKFVTPVILSKCHFYFAARSVPCLS